MVNCSNKTRLGVGIKPRGGDVNPSGLKKALEGQAVAYLRNVPPP